MINHTTVCQSFTCGCTHSLFPFFPSPWAKPLPLLAPLTVRLGGWWNLSLLPALTFSAGDVLGRRVCYLLGAAKLPFIALAGRRQCFRSALSTLVIKCMLLTRGCLPGVQLSLDSLLLFRGVLGCWIPTSSSPWQQAVLGWELGSKKWAEETWGWCAVWSGVCKACSPVRGVEEEASSLLPPLHKSWA